MEPGSPERWRSGLYFICFNRFFFARLANISEQNRTTRSLCPARCHPAPTRTRPPSTTHSQSHEHRQTHPTHTIRYARRKSRQTKITKNNQNQSSSFPSPVWSWRGQLFDIFIFHKIKVEETTGSSEKERNQNTTKACCISLTATRHTCTRALQANRTNRPPVRWMNQDSCRYRYSMSPVLHIPFGPFLFDLRDAIFNFASWIL